ncbi:MAG: TM2 domain-containing protein [Thermoleophilia bacterium]
MAQCLTCGAGLAGDATRCAKCGTAVDVPTPPAPQPVQQAQPTHYPQPPQYIAVPTAPAKSKSTFVLLAIFLGGLGVHNFYAGYNGKGVVQLVMSVLSMGILAPVVWIWAIIEAVTVNSDSSGQPFS